MNRMRMRIGVLSIALFLLSLSGASQNTSVKNDDSMGAFQAKILKTVQEKEESLGCRIGLSYRDGSLPLAVEYRGDELFHAASTMKTPVLVEVFRQAEQGIFSLSDKIKVDPVCQSFIDDSTFICDARGHMKDMLNREETILKIAEQMIVVSDNLATNLLIAKCGYRKINTTLRKMGAKKGYVLRGVQDIPAYEAGLSNRMAPKDLTAVMEAIETGKAVGVESTKEIKRILMAQHYNDMIPRFFPEDVKIAHKTGSITATRHDSAIVYAPFGTYFITIMMDGLEDGDRGMEVAAELSRLIYDEREKLSN